MLNDISQGLQRVSEIDKVYKSINSGFSGDFSKIIEKAGESYMKKEISLLEFVDLYESYKTARLQVYQLSNDRISAIENLNFVVGTNIK